MPRGKGYTHKARRVAILGFGGKGEGFDPTQVYKFMPWECWGLNYPPAWTAEAGVKWARFYQLHPWETASEEEVWGAKWCRKQRIPLYCFNQHLSAWKNHACDWLGKGYPYIQIKAHLIGNRAKAMDGFFASSWSYMVAHALYEGVREIGLFGCTLLDGSPRERLVEYPALLWWLGFARGRGVRITLPKTSDLLAYPYLYGRDYHEEVQWVRKRVRALSLQGDETIDEAWEGVLPTVIRKPLGRPKRRLDPVARPNRPGSGDVRTQVIAVEGPQAVEGRQRSTSDHRSQVTP